MCIFFLNIKTKLLFLLYLQVYREDEGVVSGYEEKGRTCVEMSCGAIDGVQHDDTNNLTDRL